MDEEFIAFHEAGHAVIGYRFHLLGDHVTINPDLDEGSLGHCQQEYCDYSPELARQQIISLYAGDAAIKRRFPDYTGYSGAEGDFESATDLLRYTDGSTESELHSQTDSLIEGNWPHICAVAEELVKAKTLNYEEYGLIIDDLDEGRNWKEDLKKYRMAMFMFKTQ